MVAKAFAGSPAERKVTDLRGWWWVDGTVKKMQHLAALRYALHDQQALKVDVDTYRGLSLRQLAERLKKNNRRLSWVVERRSPSGRGWHRWVGVQPLPASAVETVALQLLCGSDPHREAYNLNRARQVDDGKVSEYWRQRWNVFYKRERTGT